MPEERDSERPLDLDYAPPRKGEYPWWHDVLWALVLILVVMLLLSWFFSSNGS